MSTSRRSFLTNCTTAALSAGMLVSFGNLRSAFAQTKGMQLFPIPPESQMDVLYYYRMSAFSPYVNSTFWVGANGRKTGLTLTKVTDVRHRSQLGRINRPEGFSNSDSDCFSLLLRGPMRGPLPQNSYSVEHSALGTFSLLLVPIISQDKSARYYEAIINHSNP